MWWNKKEIKYTGPTKLFKRIEILYYKLCELDFGYLRKDYKWEEFTNIGFKSKLGKRRIEIINNISSYDLYYFNDDEIIFCLYVGITNTKLKPCPINLTAHQIDLAILEFENYIETIYQEHKAKIKELEG